MLQKRQFAGKTKTLQHSLAAKLISNRVQAGHLRVAASSASVRVSWWRSLSSFCVACCRFLRVVPCLRLASMWRLAPACSFSTALSCLRSASSNPSTRCCSAWLLPCSQPHHPSAHTSTDKSAAYWGLSSCSPRAARQNVAFTMLFLHEESDGICMPVVWRWVRADLLDTETLCMLGVESALKLIGR